MKKLLALLVVLAIPVGGWLYQQKPGHAYTAKNRLLHAIKVESSIRIPFKQLSGSLTEAEILQRYPALNLDCGHEASNLGERSCYASVRQVNGVDAWFVVFFFDKDHLSGLKLDIQPDGHQAMLDQLHELFGAGRPNKGRSGMVLQWHERNGVLAMNQSAYADEPSQVYWASLEKIMRDVVKRRHL